MWASLTSLRAASERGVTRHLKSSGWLNYRLESASHRAEAGLPDDSFVDFDFRCHLTLLVHTRFNVEREKGPESIQGQTTEPILEIYQHSILKSESTAAWFTSPALHLKRLEPINVSTWENTTPPRLFCGQTPRPTRIQPPPDSSLVGQSISRPYFSHIYHIEPGLDSLLEILHESPLLDFALEVIKTSCARAGANRLLVPLRYLRRLDLPTPTAGYNPTSPITGTPRGGHDDIHRHRWQDYVASRP